MKMTDEQENKLHRVALYYRDASVATATDAWEDLVKVVEGLMGEARTARAAECCGRLDSADELQVRRQWDAQRGIAGDA